MCGISVFFSIKLTCFQWSRDSSGSLEFHVCCHTSFLTDPRPWSLRIPVPAAVSAFRAAQCVLQHQSAFCVMRRLFMEVLGESSISRRKRVSLHVTCFAPTSQVTFTPVSAKPVPGTIKKKCHAVRDEKSV